MKKLEEVKITAKIGGRYGNLPDGFRSEDVGLVAQKTLDVMRQSAVDAYLALEEIQADGRLSDAGKLEKAHAAIQKAKTDKAISRQVDLWNQKAAYLEGALSRAITEAGRVKPPEAPHEVQLASDIRRHLKEMDHGDRVAAINAALEDGDPLTLGAVLNSPPYLVGLAQAELDHLTQRLAEKTAPQELRSLENLKKAQEIIQEAQVSHQGYLQDLQGEAERDPLLDANLTETMKAAKESLDHFKDPGGSPKAPKAEPDPKAEPAPKNGKAAAKEKEREAIKAEIRETVAQDAENQSAALAGQTRLPSEAELAKF